MRARINHLTIVSEDNYALGRFYEGFFHMQPTGSRGALDAVSLGDGCVGLNIHPRLAGHPAQLDHFGIEVDDLAEALKRIRTHYPRIEWLEPSKDRSAGPVFVHDPDGNPLVLSQAGDRDGGDIYEADGRTAVRAIDHVALRVPHPELVAEFYRKVFELTPLEPPTEAKNHYLSDGNVTLVIIPWRLGDFEGTGISARGMDHIGFRVESLAAFKDDVRLATERNYRLQPSASIVGKGKEGAVRLEMFRRTCPLGCHHLADSDGLIIDVRE
jgi:catechol 2,3-dioxygenase-like lactoylglutathione lyase family enzyme